MHVSRGQENGTFIARTPNKGSTIVKVTKIYVTVNLQVIVLQNFWFFNV